MKTKLDLYYDKLETLAKDIKSYSAKDSTNKYTDLVEFKPLVADYVRTYSLLRKVEEGTPRQDSWESIFNRFKKESLNDKSKKLFYGVLVYFNGLCRFSYITSTSRS